MTDSYIRKIGDYIFVAKPHFQFDDGYRRNATAQTELLIDPQSSFVNFNNVALNQPRMLTILQFTLKCTMAKAQSKS